MNMLELEDKTYLEFIQDWLGRIGYDPAFYESHTPVRQPGSVKRLTKRERELVDSVSTERGYRPFQAFRRAA